MSATTHEATTGRSALRNFFWQRSATILALLPLGVWVVVHVWRNLSAFDSPQAWSQSVVHQPHPIAAAITWTIVLLPLVLHTIWGLGRVMQSRPNNGHYNYFGNFRYLIQRVTALGVLAFVGAHIWLAFLHPRVVEGHAETFEDIAWHMRNHPPTLAVYMLGTLAVMYHLGNGLATSAMAFGIGTTQRSQKRVERIALFAFLLLLTLAWGAIYALWRAGANVPAP